MHQLPPSSPTEHIDDDRRRLLRKIAYLESRDRYDDEQSIADPTVDWFKEPHVVTAILAVLGYLIYNAFKTQSESSNYIENTKSALLAVSFFVIVLGMLTFPTSGPFSRPHPIIWRTVFSIGVLYEIFLIILLFQTKADARALISFLDPSTGVPLAERSYGDHCEFTMENVLPVLFDRFAVAHFVGWFLKAILFRDSLLCWVISVMWELVEICFTFMLPNFLECWWDQIILDVLLCNGLGIVLGIWTVRKFKMMRYDWTGAHEYPTYTEKTKRLLTQLAPQQSSSWTLQRWGISRSIKRFFGIQLVVLLFQIPELNAFFLKTLLWVPPESFLNPLRLLLWFLISLPSIRQIYMYMTNPNVKSIGRQAFLCLILMATELMIIFKFGDSTEFPNPMPNHVKYLIAGLIIAYGIFVFYGIRRIYHNQPERDIHRKVSKIIDSLDPDSPQPDLFPDFDGDIDENVLRRQAHQALKDSRREHGYSRESEYDDYVSYNAYIMKHRSPLAQGVASHNTTSPSAYDKYQRQMNALSSPSHARGKVYTAHQHDHRDHHHRANGDDDDDDDNQTGSDEDEGSDGDQFDTDRTYRPISPLVASPARSTVSNQSITSTSSRLMNNVNPSTVRGRDLTRVRAVEDEVEREQRRQRGVSLSRKQLARRPKRQTNASHRNSGSRRDAHSSDSEDRSTQDSQDSGNSNDNHNNSDDNDDNDDDDDDTPVVISHRRVGRTRRYNNSDDDDDSDDEYEEEVPTRRRSAALAPAESVASTRSTRSTAVRQQPSSVRVTRSMGRR